MRAFGHNLFRRTPELANEIEYVSSGHPGTTWYRTLAPGGLSNQWTGAVPRFAPGDFFDGERLHERYRWPLDYEDLEPFYERAERLLRITACRSEVPLLPTGWADHGQCLPTDWHEVVAVAARRGQGLTLLPLADGPEFLFVRRSTAFNSYANIIRKLTSSPLFTLRTGCAALGLEWSGLRRRVEAVVYHDRGTGHQERLAAVAVIVACGPLGSTKLLFDSACPDFPEGLGNTDGVLGRYLHDHPKEWWSVDAATAHRAARPGRVSHPPAV